MKKILLILIPVLAFVAGAVGGDVLRPATETVSGETAQSGETAEVAESTSTGEDMAKPGEGAEIKTASEKPAAEGESGAALDWFKFPNQFFVPILRNGTPTAIMVLSLTMEINASARPNIEAQEHRLRDALLNALMIEANTGGFDGNFTSDPSQKRLRTALLNAAQKAAGEDVQRILIEDIGRQEQ